MKLGTSVKQFLSVVMAVVTIAAAVLWVDDRPNELTWALRAVTTLTSLGLLIAILYLHWRDDEAHDFLRELTDRYFNCDGFAFLPGATSHDGVCWITLTFQNQRDQPCIGRARLRPAQGFWLKRNEITDIVFEVFCKPAAFGVARIPIGLAPEYQGKVQSFEVGASVEFLEKKGKLVRFWDGIPIEIDERLRRSALSTFITTTAALIGHRIVMQKPGKVAISMPEGVMSETPTNATQQTMTHWQLGDPPLTNEWRNQLA